MPVWLSSSPSDGVWVDVALAVAVTVAVAGGVAVAVGGAVADGTTVLVGTIVAVDVDCTVDVGCTVTVAVAGAVRVAVATGVGELGTGVAFLPSESPPQPPSAEATTQRTSSRELRISPPLNRSINPIVTAVASIVQNREV